MAHSSCPSPTHFPIQRSEVVVTQANDIFGWIKAGKLNVTVDRTFPLEEVCLSVPLFASLARWLCLSVGVSLHVRACMHACVCARAPDTRSTRRWSRATSIWRLASLRAKLSTRCESVRNTSERDLALALAVSRSLSRALTLAALHNTKRSAVGRLSVATARVYWESGH